jgi:hypothetical protein
MHKDMCVLAARKRLGEGERKLWAFSTRMVPFITVENLEIFGGKGYFLT